MKEEDRIARDIIASIAIIMVMIAYCISLLAIICL